MSKYSEAQLSRSIFKNKDGREGRLSAKRNPHTLGIATRHKPFKAAPSPSSLVNQA